MNDEVYQFDKGRHAHSLLGIKAVIPFPGEVQAFDLLLFFGACFVVTVVGFRLLAAAGFVRLAF